MAITINNVSEFNAAEIELVGMAANEFLHALAHRQTHTGTRAKLLRTFADEVVPDMRAPPGGSRIDRAILQRLAAQVDGLLRNLQLSAVGVFGEMRDRMAVHLAALIVHARIGFSRILRQHRLEHNQRLQQFLPRSL